MYTSNPNSWIDPLGWCGTANTSELTPTQGVTRSKNQMRALIADIRENGIREAIDVVEHNGQKFIVNGHHRFYAAIKLGIDELPINIVDSSHLGYQTVSDLIPIFRLPGFWRFL